MNIPPITTKPLSPLVTAETLKPLPEHTRAGGSAKAVSAADVKKAATQFEAIILRQLLKPSIEPMMSGGGGSGGAGGSIYGYMLTDTLANSLSAAGGLGLSGMLEKQFSANTAKAAPPKFPLHP